LSASNGFEGLNGPIREVDESRIAFANISVFERLAIEGQQIPDKRKGRELAELERSRVDETTGQPLYQPKTGKAVRGRAQEVSQEGGVSNYLYKKH